ncbi:MAG: hypothetical protein RLZZ136_672 [Pseudomonadota bacterium]|jgi:hypothetical protein
MNKFTPLALAATLATFSLFPMSVHAETAAPSNAGFTVGKTIYSANGQRIAPIYRVKKTGVVQVILDGKLVTVPVETLSNVDGKVTTSLTKADLLHAQ